MARALRPGGRLALTAFSAYFQVRFLGEADSFDAERGVNHEHTAIKDEDGREVPTDLWTTCFTPRELRLLAESAGLRPEHVWSVTPGDYAARPPDIELRSSCSSPAGLDLPGISRPGGLSGLGRFVPPAGRRLSGDFAVPASPEGNGESEGGNRMSSFVRRSRFWRWPLP